MKLRSFALSAILSFLLASGELCIAQHMNEPDSPCAGVATTSDLVACLDQAESRSEAKMNALYQKIKSRLDAGQLEELTKTQQLWLNYREANCAAEHSLYGRGSGGPPAQLACIEAMTRERTKELQVTYAVRLKD